MTSFTRFNQTISLILISFMVSLTLAQMNGSNPIVGIWQTSIQLGQGMPNATGIFQAQPNGQYREELYMQGQLAAYWEGQYSLAPDGTLSQQETSKSPQICMQGQCFANEGPSSSVSRVSVQGTDSFTVTGQDPASGQVYTLNWQRSGGQSNVPSNQPTSQATPAGSQTPIVGTWQYVEPAPAGKITITLSYTADGRFMVQRVLNGQMFMASYGGNYTFNNGMLVETTTEKSPQFCYLQCQPNPAQLGTSSPMQVSFPNSSTLLYAGLTFQRAQPSQGGMPAPSNWGSTQPVPGGYAPGGYSPDMSGGMGTDTGYYSPSTDNSAFVDGVIWEQSPYLDSSTGDTFLLPDSPDADTLYTSPNGNDLRYDDSASTWYEVDPYGFETEVEQGDW